MAPKNLTIIKQYLSVLNDERIEFIDFLENYKKDFEKDKDDSCELFHVYGQMKPEKLNGYANRKRTVMPKSGSLENITDRPVNGFLCLNPRPMTALVSIHAQKANGLVLTKDMKGDLNNPFNRKFFFQKVTHFWQKKFTTPKEIECKLFV